MSTGFPTQNVRTAFISDVHLGTRGCQAELLLDFIRHLECDTLYLVGDIIDGWKLKGGWYWPRRTTTWCRRSCAWRARA
jgi:UDP-2,3-diacylglucosamine pyrophosphatase LpxH